MTRINRSRQEGFTLIEVVIAMVVFAMMSTVVLGLVLKVTGTARTNDLRITAAGLADKHIEGVRGTPVDQISDKPVVTSEKVGSTTFTVTQTSALVGTNSSLTLCDANAGSLAYRMIAVKVTWPGMGQIPAVHAETLKVIGTSELTADAGTIGILIKDAAGVAVGGIPVTLSPSGQTQTTGEDGCAVFLKVPVGSYSARAAQAGYVGQDGRLAPTVTNIAVQAGLMSRGQLVLDKAGSQPLAVETLTGYTQIASSLPISVRSAYVGPTQLPGSCAASGGVCLTGGQGTNLFPAQYSFWAGGCHDSMSSLAVAKSTISAGQEAAPITLPLAKVNVVVLRSGVPTAGVGITVKHPADPVGTPAPACGSGFTYSATSADPGTGLLMPYGTWTFSVSGSPPVTVTLQAGVNNVYVGN